MDFKQYLKESLTSLGEGASDVSRALIDFGKTYRPMYANEQVDETLNPREDWQKKTPDLDKQVKGLLELPMAVGAPLTPSTRGKLPRVERSAAPKGWEFIPPPIRMPIEPSVDFKPINPKTIEQGPNTASHNLHPYTDMPRLDAELQREINLPDPNVSTYTRYLIEQELEQLNTVKDKYGLNYAYRENPNANPYRSKFIKELEDKNQLTSENVSDALKTAREANEKDLDNALSILAKTTGLPPEAIGLRGGLSLFPDHVPYEFRNKSNIRGLFSAMEDSIYIKKRVDEKPYDALGHEWFHALDRYLGAFFGKEAGTRLNNDGIPSALSRSTSDYPLRYGSGSYDNPNVAELDQMFELRARSNAFDAGVHDDDLFKKAIKTFINKSLPNMRPELRDRWSDLMYYIHHPHWTNSINKMRKEGKHRDYVQSPIEKGARAFDAWLTHKNNDAPTPILTSDESLFPTTHFDNLPMKDQSRDDDFIRDMFKAFDNFFEEIRVRGATRSDGKKIVELFGGAAPFGMLAGMSDEKTQKKATPPKDITKGWTSPFDEEDKKFIDRPLDTLKEKRGPSKLWDDYWSSQLPGQSPNQR